ncbi:TIGR02117 family protein [Jiella mangrovi]|uniref:TIGR02117 family protein n=1 Tax=Jiella mangrovi TaxID=2821407 RepID=A0ABS4BBC3_9HYPH|nr:TIGR02117 family protein [Jiella mangrovi]MBP0614051.1 TIGR02117 family protein [Jiella mangrovi]
MRPSAEGPRTRLRAFLLRGTAFSAGLILACLVLGVVIPFGGTGRDNDGAASKRILVLKGPIHSDIALPADGETRRRFAFLAGAGLPIAAPQVRWLVIGWGGRSFYTKTRTWADLRPLPVVKTILGDASTLHVALAGPIDDTAAAVKTIGLSDAAYQRLIASVLQSFRRTAADEPPTEIVGTGYGPYDRFFEARGTFQILANCNSWTAAMLRDAGVTTGLWTPLPQLLFLSLDLHGAGGADRPG